MLGIVCISDMVGLLKLEYCTSECVSFVVQICTGISGSAISRALVLPIPNERLWKQGFAKCIS